jgi:hypothetical protein
LTKSLGYEIIDHDTLDSEIRKEHRINRNIQRKNTILLNDKSKKDIENNDDTDDKDEQSMTEVQKQQNIRLNKIRKRNPINNTTNNYNNNQNSKNTKFKLNLTPQNINELL